MTRLIVQADDAAITHAATLGTLDSITNGIVRATGLFTNCAAAPFAAAALRELEGVDVGIDLNFVTGRPLLPADEVPGLVDERGVLRSSGSIRSEYVVTGGDGVFLEFEVDPFDPAQTRAEADAQVARFFELMGRPPAYVHHHSLVSPVSDAVLRDVAASLGVLAVDDLYRTGGLPLLPNEWYTAPFPVDVQARADAVGAMERLIPRILEHDISLLITHPGYVDAELLDITSYSIVRARDAEAMTSPHVRRMLDDAGIELTTFTAAGLA